MHHLLCNLSYIFFFYAGLSSGEVDGTKRKKVINVPAELKDVEGAESSESLEVSLTCLRCVSSVSSVPFVPNVFNPTLPMLDECTVAQVLSRSDKMAKAT